MAELEDMARYATRYYERIEPADLRFVLVEATGHILPEGGEDMARYTLGVLRDRGIDIRLNTRLGSCVGGHVVLSDGRRVQKRRDRVDGRVTANPVLAQTDLPLDAGGRVKTLPNLTVEGVADAFAAGDSAAVPDVTKPGQITGPSAQHAVRQYACSRPTWCACGVSH